VSIQFHRDTYDSISQRAIATLAQGLSVFEPVATGPSEAAGQPGVDAQHDLHQFFAALYAAMFEQPERFGMPTSPDDALNNEKEGKERRQEVTKKIKRAQELRDLTLDLLQELGRKGQVTGEALVVDEATYRSLFEAKSKTKKVILAGMGEAGLAALATNGSVTIRNTRYPQMMPALKAMAERCAEGGDEEGGSAQADFRTRNVGCLTGGANSLSRAAISRSCCRITHPIPWACWVTSPLRIAPGRSNYTTICWLRVTKPSVRPMARTDGLSNTRDHARSRTARW